MNVSRRISLDQLVEHLTHADDTSLLKNDVDTIKILLGKRTHKCRGESRIDDKTKYSIVSRRNTNFGLK